MRMQGKTFRYIAKELDLSVAYVFKSVVARTQGVANQRAEELIDFELGTLNTAQIAIWDAVEAGDNESIRTLIGIVSARCKILGFDGKTQLEDMPQKERRARLMAWFQNPDPELVDMLTESGWKRELGGSE